MILGVIVACEIGFWAAVLLGLTARYVLRRRGVGAALLVCAPLIDLVLLLAIAAHLSTGATASWHHGLGALYLGISAAYGTRMVAWADVRFAHRFAGGPAPVRLTGRTYTVRCWGDVGRTLGAALLAAALLAAITVWVGDPARTEALTRWYGILTTVVVVELLWAISYTVWPRRPDRPATVDVASSDGQ